MLQRVRVGPAVFLARDDPYGSITGIPSDLPPHPTSTASALVAAYAQEVQTCGQAVNDALQQLIPAYLAYADIDPSRSNVTISDPGLLSYATTAPLYEQATQDCTFARISLGNLEESEISSATTQSSDASSPTTVQATSAGHPALSATSLGSTATTTPKTGGALGHLYQPNIFITSLLALIVWFQ
ncbi:hypothetical protein C8R47DRAFT_1214455 [Mycena vitilis]|nr:hypothetical protein C8R47DRAFT_1214455 [Mycena vitilis]